MIYLDNNATTKVDQRVFYKHCEVLNRFYGNPSSMYPTGIVAKEFVSKAREQVASFINANTNSGDKVLFTSCATESNNAVLYSAIQPNISGKHIVISSVEHPSILNPASFYESIGCEVTRIAVNSDGLVDEDQLLGAIKENTSLVSIMLVNSETGVVQNIERIAQKIKSLRPDLLFHTDAVQAAGKLPLDVMRLGVDFLTLSGHKFHAPKGIGVLYIKAGVPFIPFLIGGHQENGLRGGTENTASIVAIGEAASIAQERLGSGVEFSIASLRDKMERLLQESFPDSIIFGKNVLRVCNTTNIGFKNVIGDKLVLQLAQKGICVSSGTACNSVNMEPSSVLKAMNAPEDYIYSIRISLSKETVESDILALIKALKEIL